jgi:hypothetical protein
MTSSFNNKVFMKQTIYVPKKFQQGGFNNHRRWDKSLFRFLRYEKELDSQVKFVRRMFLMFDF